MKQNIKILPFADNYTRVQTKYALSSAMLSSQTTVFFLYSPFTIHIASAHTRIEKNMKINVTKRENRKKYIKKENKKKQGWMK